MGLRGILRDVLSIYVGYKVVGMWLLGSKFDSSAGWTALALLLLSLWFVCERVGIIPKYW